MNETQEKMRLNSWLIIIQEAQERKVALSRWKPKPSGKTRSLLKRDYHNQGDLGPSIPLAFTVPAEFWR
jgi:hypothetical protein